MLRGKFMLSNAYIRKKHLGEFWKRAPDLQIPGLSPQNSDSIDGAQSWGIFLEVPGGDSDAQWGLRTTILDWEMLWSSTWRNEYPLLYLGNCKRKDRKGRHPWKNLVLYLLGQWLSACKLGAGNTCVV